MPKIAANGIEIYYEQEGSGPDLVFISGLAADHTVWDVSLYQKKFRTLTFDNRGIGRSDIPEGPYTLEMLTDDVKALCQNLNIKKAHFVGHSMGGHILQYLGAFYPEIIDKLVIACSEPEFSIISNLATKMAIELEPYNLPKELLVQNYLPYLFSKKFLENGPLIAEIVKKFANNPYPQPPKGYKAQVAALRNHDTKQILDKIKTETLIIGCEEDLLTPLENSHYLKNHMPRATLKIIEKCGHIPYIEKPKEFSETILNFLTKES